MDTIKFYLVKYKNLMKNRKNYHVVKKQIPKQN